jgi:hypothetical protein
MSTTVKVWNGWNFENIAKGPRGEIGATGKGGVRGPTGSTGPAGADGLAGPAGRSGDVGPSAKGPSAPLSRFVKSGADGATKYLYDMSDFRNYERGNLTYNQRIEGENDDAYGLGLIAVEVAGSEGAWTVSGSFFRAEYYPTSGNVSARTLETFTKQVPTLYGAELWSGYIRLDTNTYCRLYMQEGLLEFIRATTTSRIFTCNLVATSTPPGNYVYPQADNTPTKDDTLSLVSSGGVATAYCALIDKLAQYKGLSAAQVAMMKALYGA